MHIAQALAATANTEVLATHQDTEPRPLPKSVVNFNWNWQLVGTETPDEARISNQMLFEAQRFTAEIWRREQPRWLTIIGLNGCGKTYLARAIADWWLAHKHAMLYGGSFQKWQVLLGKLREGEHRQMSAACDDPFKVIDDFGTGAIGGDGEPTAFAVSKMGELLDRRLGKWTVITSNFSRQQFAEQFDTRIASRLIRGENEIFDCGTLDDWALREERINQPRP